MSSLTTPATVPAVAVLPAAGWYADPVQRWRWRYWDGQQWTPGVSDGARVVEEALPVDNRMRLPARAGWLVLAGLVGGEAMGAGLALLGRLVSGHNHLVELLLGQAGLWGAWTVAIVFASRRWGTGRVFRDFGVQMKAWDPAMGLGLSVLMRFASIIAVLPIVLIFHRYFAHAPDSPQLFGNHEHAVDFLVLAAIATVGAPFIEEIFFRGLLMGSLRRFGAWRAIVIQGVIFGCVHMQPSYGRSNIITAVAIGAGGIGLGWSATHFKRLCPGMWTHAFFNLQVVIGFAFVALN